MSEFHYVGQELDVFSLAVRWKRYWRDQITPYLGATVLEVGAGIGGTTRVVCDARFTHWLGLEPDAAMARALLEAKARGEFPANCEFRIGQVGDLSAEEQFDSVLYIDVLEHIEDDAGELRRAMPHVRPGGHLIVLSPAFQWLYTPFDAAIGHYRRYTRARLKALTPPGSILRRGFYLDSVGLLASLGNKLLLRSPQPSAAQIRFWDSTLVPVSRGVDALVGYHLGRSVICVWQRVER